MRRAMVLMAAVACSRPATQNCPPAPAPQKPSFDASGLVPPPMWPAVPATSSDAQALVDKLRGKPAASAPPATDADAIERASQDLFTARAGEDAIAEDLSAWLAADKKPAYVVFGSTHDSAEQLEIVTHLVTRTRGLWALSMEQLRAAGDWRGAARPVESDDADLARLLADQDDALAGLRDRQQRLDYAAYKFDYVPRVLDALLAARGARVAPVACDMPANLRAAMPKDATDELVSALRELHCARALESRLAELTGEHLPDGFEVDDTPPSPRAALFVGENHAYKSGVASFLPSGSRVRTVVLVGGRAPGYEGAPRAGRIRALLPVMLRVNDSTAALVLPEHGLAAERLRDHGVPPPAHPTDALAPTDVFVSSDVPITFELPRVKLTVDKKVEGASARAAHHLFALRTPTEWWMGQLHVPQGGWTEVRWAAGALSITEHEP